MPLSDTKVKARAEMLRKWSQYAYDDEVTAPIDRVPAEYVTVFELDQVDGMEGASPEEFQSMFLSLLGEAIEIAPKNRFIQAYVNSIDGDGATLTDRRQSFLAERGDMSHRTLIRHEQLGAELLAQYFDDVLADQVDSISEEEEDGVEIDLQVIRKRLKKLEEQHEVDVASIDQILEALVAYKPDSKPIDLFFGLRSRVGEMRRQATPSTQSERQTD
ncbi:hypothetical protein [Subtercola sp. RTI3]|uniref:hypothetical protein n=1 Tax=Subtercola sp. RTI3 TaxID=3048639 RepID=UPI002B22A826|nr:hypothetical protein [Subtercola sp. RTI3]MEA9986272.1 hypothetical protein [Subtercola sp. RTI3]